MLILFGFIIFICFFVASIAVYSYIKKPIDSRAGIKNASLEKTEHCCNCKSKKIIYGTISSDSSEGISFFSTDFKFKPFSTTKRPGAKLEGYQFTICTECGLLGGFVNISNIQNELKTHGKQSLLDRLNNDMPTDCD